MSEHVFRHNCITILKRIHKSGRSEFQSCECAFSNRRHSNEGPVILQPCSSKKWGPLLAGNERSSYRVAAFLRPLIHLWNWWSRVQIGEEWFMYVTVSWATLLEFLVTDYGAEEIETLLFIHSWNFILVSEGFPGCSQKTQKGRKVYRIQLDCTKINNFSFHPLVNFLKHFDFFLCVELDASLLQVELSLWLLNAFANQIWIAQKCGYTHKVVSNQTKDRSM